MKKLILGLMLFFITTFGFCQKIVTEELSHIANMFGTTIDYIYYDEENFLVIEEGNSYKDDVSYKISYFFEIFKFYLNEKRIKIDQADFDGLVYYTEYGRSIIYSRKEVLDILLERNTIEKSNKILNPQQQKY